MAPLAGVLSLSQEGCGREEGKYWVGGEGEEGQTELPIPRLSTSFAVCCHCLVFDTATTKPLLIAKGIL
jgi:hypothetical protein